MRFLLDANMPRSALGRWQTSATRPNTRATLDSARRQMLKLPLTPGKPAPRSSRAMWTLPTSVIIRRTNTTESSWCECPMTPWQKPSSVTRKFPEANGTLIQNCRAPGDSRTGAGAFSSGASLNIFMDRALLLQYFEELAETPDAVEKLRRLSNQTVQTL